MHSVNQGAIDSLLQIQHDGWLASEIIDQGPIIYSEVNYNQKITEAKFFGVQVQIPETAEGSVFKVAIIPIYESGHERIGRWRVPIFNGAQLRDIDFSNIITIRESMGRIKEVTFDLLFFEITDGSKPTGFTSMNLQNQISQFNPMPEFALKCPFPGVFPAILANIKLKNALKPANSTKSVRTTLNPTPSVVSIQDSLKPTTNGRGSTSPKSARSDMLRSRSVTPIPEIDAKSEPEQKPSPLLEKLSEKASDPAKPEDITFQIQLVNVPSFGKGQDLWVELSDNSDPEKSKSPTKTVFAKITEGKSQRETVSLADWAGDIYAIVSLYEKETLIWEKQVLVYEKSGKGFIAESEITVPLPKKGILSFTSRAPAETKIKILTNPSARKASSLKSQASRKELSISSPLSAPIKFLVDGGLSFPSNVTLSKIEMAMVDSVDKQIDPFDENGVQSQPISYINIESDAYNPKYEASLYTVVSESVLPFAVRIVITYVDALQGNIQIMGYSHVIIKSMNDLPIDESPIILQLPISMGNLSNPQMKVFSIPQSSERVICARLLLRMYKMVNDTQPPAPRDLESYVWKGEAWSVEDVYKARLASREKLPVNVCLRMKNPELTEILPPLAKELTVKYQIPTKGQNQIFADPPFCLPYSQELGFCVTFDGFDKYDSKAHVLKIVYQVWDVSKSKEENTMPVYFTKAHDWDSDTNRQRYMDDYQTFDHIELNTNVVLLIRLYKTDLKKQAPIQFTYCGWGILPLVHDLGFLMTGSYRLPLYAKQFPSNVFSKLPADVRNVGTYAKTKCSASLIRGPSFIMRICEPNIPAHLLPSKVRYTNMHYLPGPDFEDWTTILESKKLVKACAKITTPTMKETEEELNRDFESFIHSENSDIL